MHKIFLIIIILAVLGGGYWLRAKGPKEQLVTQSDTKINESTTTSTTTNKQIMSATLHTNKGDIEIEFSKDTPNTVANFVKLAGEGFYDGVKFHRVIKDFMIQSGDPLSKDDALKSRWGTGGPGYSFKDEITPNNHNDVGTIAMANSGPDTNGSQFFINANNNNFLDQKHTVFGKVVKGLEVVKMIDEVATDKANDQPLEPVVISSITLK